MPPAAWASARSAPSSAQSGNSAPGWRYCSLVLPLAALEQPASTVGDERDFGVRSIVAQRAPRHDGVRTAVPGRAHCGGECGLAPPIPSVEHGEVRKRRRCSGVNRLQYPHIANDDLHEHERTADSEPEQSESCSRVQPRIHLVVRDRQMRCAGEKPAQYQCLGYEAAVLRQARAERRLQTGTHALPVACKRRHRPAAHPRLTPPHPPPRSAQSRSRWPKPRIRRIPCATPDCPACGHHRGC